MRGPRVVAGTAALAAGAALAAAGGTTAGVWPSSDPTYARVASKAERHAIQSAVARRCRVKGWTCKPTKVEVGRSAAKAPFGKDVRGWASSAGQVSPCPDGCAFQAIVKRVAIRPLRYRVVSFFGPAGGVAGSCYLLYWGGPYFPGGRTHPPAPPWRRLPGAVVWTFRPLCDIEPGRTISDFYPH